MNDKFYAQNMDSQFKYKAKHKQTDEANGIWVTETLQNWIKILSSNRENPSNAYQTEM